MAAYQKSDRRRVYLCAGGLRKRVENSSSRNSPLEQNPDHIRRALRHRNREHAHCFPAVVAELVQRGGDFVRRYVSGTAPHNAARLLSTSKPCIPISFFAAEIVDDNASIANLAVIGAHLARTLAQQA
jgi:hypothetical protein